MDRVEVRALHRQVLVVGVASDVIGDWSAYIGPVQGEDHGMEAAGVRRHGEKLPYAVAAALFPDLAAHYRWR